MPIPPDRLRARSGRGLTAWLAIVTVAIVVGLAFLEIWDSRQAAVAAAERATWTGYVASLAAAEASIRDDRIDAARENLERAPRALRGWEWDHLASRLDRCRRVVYRNVDAHGEPSAVHGLAALGDRGLVLQSASDPSAVHGGRTLAIDIESGDVTPIEDPSGSPLGVDGSPNGRFLASARAHSLVIVDVTRPEKLRSIEVPQCVRPLFLSDQRLLAVEPTGGLIVLDAKSGAPLVHSGTITQVVSAALAPDGRDVVVGSWNQTAAILDARTLALGVSLRGHTGSVDAVAYSPDGAEVVTGSDDGTVRFWDPQSGEQLAVEDVPGGAVTTLAFLPAGELLVAGPNDGVVHVLHPDGRWSAWVGHDGPVTGIAVTPAGDAVFTSSADGTVREWRVGESDVPTFANTPYAHGVAWAPDGDRFAVAGYDGVVRVWRRSTGALESELALASGAAEAVAWSPGGKWLFAQDDSARLHRFAHARTPDALPLPDAPRSVATAAAARFRLPVAADGRLLTLSGSAAFCVRDEDGQVVNELSADPAVRRAIWSQFGDRIVTADRVGVSVRELDATPVWTVATGAPPAALALGVGGASVLVSTEEGAVLVLDVVDGHERGRFETREPVWSLAVAPDGSRLATGDAAGTVRLWTVGDWRATVALFGHRARVAGLAFAPDGSALLSASWDGTVRLWERFADR